MAEWPLCLESLMNSQARRSHNIFQWVSPHFLFWTFSFLNIWYWMTGAEYYSLKSTPFCLFHTLFYFNITISLFWVRNINVSNGLPELSLLFHVYVRYYSPNFNKLLSFSFLKRVVVEKSSFGIILTLVWALVTCLTAWSWPSYLPGFWGSVSSSVKWE